MNVKYKFINLLQNDNLLKIKLKKRTFFVGGALYSRPFLVQYETIQEQRDFLEDISRKLNIKKFDDWYSVSQFDFLKYGGYKISHKYSNSHIDTIICLYPEYFWKRYKFAARKGFWNVESRVENLRYTINCIEDELNIKKIDDWNYVTMKQLNSVGATTLFLKIRLSKLLPIIYPDHPWDFTKRFNKNQKILLNSVQKIFSDLQIESEYIIPGMMYSSTREPMEFDVFVPSINLAFEYQGEQHYNYSIKYFGQHSRSVKERDKEKKERCKEMSITLIEVPYWWIGGVSGSQEELVATIYKHRPDLVENPNVNPIPEVNPKSSNRKITNNKEDFEEKGYVLSIGTSHGSVPSCKGCGHLFTDRKELRIRSVAKTTYWTGFVTFCVKISCIENWTMKKKRKTSFDLFDGSVKVPPSILESIDGNFENLPQVGIQWKI